MAWIESHQSLSRHRKTMRAAALLRIHRLLLVGHLHELWWWALDCVPPDGDLGDTTEAEIESAACWEGEPGVFVRALIEAGGKGRPGFIERNAAGNLALHHWHDYAGKLLERRAKDRERKRGASDGDSDGIPAEPPVEVQRSRVRTVPYPTKPTEPETGGGKGEPSVGPSADAEGAPSASPAADAAPPPAAELPSAQPEQEPETEPEAPTPIPPPPPADPLLPALARLRALPGYRAAEDDLTWLADRARLFGAADALEREVAKCADHWADKDAKSLNVVKPKWRSRLSKWLDNAAKFERERATRSGRVVDLHPAQPRARDPDAGWLDTDERRREVGL